MQNRRIQKNSTKGVEIWKDVPVADESSDGRFDPPVGELDRLESDITYLFFEVNFSEGRNGQLQLQYLTYSSCHRTKTMC